MVVIDPKCNQDNWFLYSHTRQLGAPTPFLTRFAARATRPSSAQARGEARRCRAPARRALRLRTPPRQTRRAFALPRPTWARRTCKGIGAQIRSLGRPLKGWRVASKRLGPLPRIKWAALGRDCGREGSGALQLPRAAAVSTRLRVRVEVAVAGGGASARKQARKGGRR